MNPLIAKTLAVLAPAVAAAAVAVVAVGASHAARGATSSPSRVHAAVSAAPTSAAGPQWAQEAHQKRQAEFVDCVKSKGVQVLTDQDGKQEFFVPASAGDSLAIMDNAEAACSDGPPPSYLTSASTAPSPQ